MDLSLRYPPGSRVVDFPGLDSERFGTVIEYRPMRDREGLFPVVKWDAGYASFSSPEWGLKGSGTKLERLRERLSQDFPGCSAEERKGSVYIKTPGAEFKLVYGKLEPCIPSPRYKKLSVVVAALWTEEVWL
ncbi:hypothetical protein [Stenomitos frigidus]|nr:hypothetical protein [Stenomitos frigidus]